MRVLLVGNHWTAGPGGAETMLVATAELLAARGHTVLPFAVAEDGSLPAATRGRFPPAAAHARGPARARRLPACGRCAPSALSTA